MKKLKICVYAICKNEEKFVDRWAESMKEADSIYVLDTGSNDNTVEKLKKHNIIVKEEIINPWRFDVARNRSLEMVPDDIDICVCTDLDEVLEKGWRNKLEKLWKKNTDRLHYHYNWSFDENGIPAISFYTDKIHKRHGYSWMHPVHEVLTYKEAHENIITTDDIVLNHYPDHTKSRSSYLNLLELSVEECPNDDRNMHYLGREYMFHSKWNEAIDTLIKHLSLKTAKWKDERCASMRFIGRCYKNLNRFDEAKLWYEKAILEAPYLRDAYIEYATMCYNLNDFKKVYDLCKKAFLIKKHEKNYINETFSWNETIYDLLTISSFKLGYIEESLIYINMALNINPNDKRLINNKKIIEEIIKKNNTL